MTLKDTRKRSRMIMTVIVTTEVGTTMDEKEIVKLDNGTMSICFSIGKTRKEEVEGTREDRCNVNTSTMNAMAMRTTTTE